MLEDIGDVDTKSTFLPWQNMAIYRGGYRMPMARRLPPPLSTLPLSVCRVRLRSSRRFAGGILRLPWACAEPWSGALPGGERSTVPTAM
jgi:hypothetical protein